MIFRQRFWTSWFKKGDPGDSSNTLDLSGFLASPERDQFKVLSDNGLAELIQGRTSFALRWLGDPTVVSCVLMKNSVAFCLHGTEAGSALSSLFEKMFEGCKVQRHGPVVGAWTAERDLDVAGLLLAFMIEVPHKKNDHLMHSKVEKNISHLSG